MSKILSIGKLFQSSRLTRSTSIGRTARGKSTEGNSYTFFTNSKSDRGCAAELVQLMRDAEQEIPQALDDLAYAASAGRNSGRAGNRWGGNGRGAGRFGGGGGNRFGGGGRGGRGGGRGGRW